MSSSHFTNIIYQQPTHPIDRFCINELQIKNIKEGRRRSSKKFLKTKLNLSYTEHWFHSCKITWGISCCCLSVFQRPWASPSTCLRTELYSCYSVSYYLYMIAFKVLSLSFYAFPSQIIKQKQFVKAREKLCVL